MNAALNDLLAAVDVTMPLHWDCAPIHKMLLEQFNYIIEVSEHESMEWRDAAGGFVPVLGDWFCTIVRRPTEAGDYFPNEWETEAFRLPGRLGWLSFDYGDLERILNFAGHARFEFIMTGCSAIIVFRPGPHWLPRREPAAGAGTITARGAA